MVDKIKEGYRIGFGLEAAEIGRKIPKSRYTVLANPPKSSIRGVAFVAREGYAFSISGR